MDVQIHNRTAQACEPCRRKKSKCTGERPVCSFCQRLSQTCSYKDRESDTSRSRKRRRSLSPNAGTGTRLAELEATVEEIVDALTLIRKSTQRSAAAETLPQAQAANVVQDKCDFDAEDWLSKKTTLSPETLVEIYAQRFHGQPLLLFDLSNLSRDLRRWPRHLFFSFFALISRFTSFHENGRSLVQIACRDIETDRTEISACIRNIQALCLLTLWEISHGEATSASMHITITQALSLQLVRSSQMGNLDISRCWCSAVILASMFGKEPQPFPSSSAVGRPDQTISPSLPKPPRISAPIIAIDWPQDTGIYAICIDLFELWARAMSLSHSIRNGQATSFWSAQSPYHEVRTALFEFETRMSPNHRLREAGFALCSPAEIDKDVCYWKLWFTSQVLFHAIHLVINHPFIQIVNQQRLRTFQPPSFRQQTVDQTLLHAKWIVRLHQMRIEKCLELDDPFIAHLSAVVATAYVFFLDSKDPKVKLDAVKGFGDCQTLVARYAQRWDHLRHTCKLLEALSSTKSDQSQRTVRLAWLWDILNYNSSTSDETSDYSGETVSLEMTTQFTSPVDQADIHQIEDDTGPSSSLAQGGVAQLEFHNTNEPSLLDLDTNFLTGTDEVFADLNPDSWFDLGRL